jgi:hypothetical protein
MDRAGLFAELERAEAAESGRIVQIEDLARSYKPRELQEAATQAQRVPLRYRKAYLTALAAHWATTDPKEALAFASKIADKEMSRVAIHAALTTWIDASTEQALAWLQENIGGSAKGFAWDAISVLQKRDPARAVAYMQGFPKGKVQPYSYESTFEAWTRSDPQAAATGATNLTPGEVRQAALGYVAAVWAASDPKAALAWVSGIPEARVRDELKSKVLGKWLEKDSDSLLDWARQSGDSALQVRIEKMVWSSLTSSDPAEARRRAMALPEGDEKKRVLTTMALQRAYQNIEDAIGITALLPSDAQAETKVEIVRTLSRGGIRDPRSFCDLALTLPPGDERVQALSSAMQKWASSAPREAATWLEQTGQLASLPLVARTIAGSWAGNDLSAARTWVNQLPEEVRQQAMPSIVSAVLANSPTEAAELFANELSPRQQEGASWWLAGNWARQDFDAAARWAQNLPPSLAQQNAMGSLATVLAEKEPAKAAAWLDQLAAGPGRDAAVEKFSWAVKDRDPVGAIAWAASLSDATKRVKQIEGLARNWMAYDAAAATQWITTTSDLSDEAKRALLQQGVR